MIKEYLKSFDNIEIPYLEYKHEDNQKRKHLVFFHDSQESINHYEEFGSYFYEKGYNVYIMEYRGHGSLKENDVLTFGPKRIEASLKDANLFIKTKLATVNFDDIVLIGEGLGALIAYYISIGTAIKNIVISSILLDGKLSVSFGLFITKIEEKLRIKESYYNKYLKTADKKFVKEGKLSYITRDKAIQDILNNDEEYIKTLSPSAFNDIFRLMRFIKKNFKKINSGANILCIYGTDDTFLLPNKIKKYMTNINKKNRSIKLVKNKDGRHNSLLEINREDIYKEINNFITKIK